VSARDEILARVRGAVSDVTAPPGSRGEVRVVEATSSGRAETLDLFVERVADYRARVMRTGSDGVPAAVAEALAEHRCESVVAPSGLESAWTSALNPAVAVVAEADATTHAQLDSIDAVVTAAAVGIAVTGTIVLDHRADQGRRELSLVPDVHVCVIATDQVVHDVPEAVARLRPDPGSARALTWISGPSATSDIELNRVEGVHGPRTLVVILVD
jgi:L-lactate dehydrogenase complex protein LldG